MNRKLETNPHASPAAPYSRPGLRRRLAALHAGLRAAVRALRATGKKH